jgi:hypothetical protein
LSLLVVMGIYILIKLKQVGAADIASERLSPLASLVGCIGVLGRAPDSR